MTNKPGAPAIHGLYAIADSAWLTPDHLLPAVEQALLGGAGDAGQMHEGLHVGDAVGGPALAPQGEATLLVVDGGHEVVREVEPDEAMEPGLGAGIK